MTSTMSCRTRKNNASTTSPLPIITRGTHEDTASPPPPHAAATAAHRRRCCCHREEGNRPYGQVNLVVRRHAPRQGQMRRPVNLEGDGGEGGCRDDEQYHGEQHLRELMPRPHSCLCTRNTTLRTQWWTTTMTTTTTMRGGDNDGRRIRSNTPSRRSMSLCPSIWGAVRSYWAGRGGTT